MEDKEQILIEKIEELNSEYLNSDYYSLGKHISYLRNLLKKKKYITFMKMILLHLRNRNKKSLNTNQDDEKLNNNKKYVIKQDENKKIVVYTCITGKYDKVEEPLVTESNCDYVLFTNNKELKSDIWQIKEIPKDIENLKDNIIINRYIKMHPSELFKKYDYSIYIDGNIKIISKISHFIKYINNENGLAIHRHCVNNCIYKEINTCIAFGKGNRKMLKKQYRRYRKENFPKEFGMVECNVLVSDLNNDNQKKIFDGWWNEYLISESKRDQISLPYIIWKNNYRIEQIGILGKNVNKNKYLKINSHN